MRTLTRSLSVAVLVALIAALPLAAEDANQLYKFKFKDPKNDGYFDTLQEKYVWFRAKKGFHLFDAYTGEQKWSHKELPDFDGNYNLLVNEKYLLYSTKKGVARLDVETGNIDWSTELSKLKFKDVDRRWWTDHGYIFQIKNNFTLLDVESGKEQWSIPLKPSSDLANKRGLQWFFDLGDRFLFLAKDGPVLIDARTGETLLSIKDKYNKKVDPVVLLDHQLMFFFDKRVALVDLESATETISIEGKVEEASSFQRFEIGGKTYVFFGFNKRLIAFDADNGQKLWETPEESVEGSVRWLRPGPTSDSVLIVTLRSDKFGKDAGTWLKMYSFDVQSGAINWSQMIGYSQLASVFVNKAFNSEASSRGGMDIGIWFEEPIVDGDNLIFLSKSLVSGDPVTLERKESQGFLSINTQTGQVNFQAKFQILDAKGKGYGGLGVGPLHDPNDGYPGVIDLGETLVAAGFGTLNAVDKSSGAILWQLEMPGIVTDITHSDGTLFCQIGKMVVSSNLEKGKIKTNSFGRKPYGFSAVEAGSGKMLWSTTDFKVDPTLALAATIDEGVLYGCDGKILYALSLADGSYKWKFDIDKDGKAGKITGDKAWAVKMEKSTFYGISSNTVTTTWSDPRRILRPEYRGTHFIVFGEKQIIRVNKDGKLAWAYKWKYDPNQANLLFDPTFFGSTDNIVYACKGFVGLDGETGKALWEDKDVKGEFTRVADDLLVVRRKDSITGYSLK